MRPEARPIEFTNGRIHFYDKKIWITRDIAAEHFWETHRLTEVR